MKVLSVQLTLAACGDTGIPTREHECCADRQQAQGPRGRAVPQEQRGVGHMRRMGRAATRRTTQEARASDTAVRGAPSSSCWAECLGLVPRAGAQALLPSSQQGSECPGSGLRWTWRLATPRGGEQRGLAGALLRPLWRLSSGLSP